ncbi:MAG: c-type cytochrome biogenesis protein CcmI [Rhodobacteraceae bacterium]|nr:c-type cytochrome biogenesis protein CcmI [Paracoccaceae bacterium]
MIFWIVTTALALAVSGLLALALLRRKTDAEPPAAYDLRVYRDQLKEVDRDLARGVIDQGDAERVRTEVSRRILAADAQLQRQLKDGGRQGPGNAILAAALAAVLVLGGAALYRHLGSPGYDDLPRQLRIDQAGYLRETRPDQAAAEADMPPRPDLQAPDPQYTELMDKLRATVAERPDDLQGHVLLAQNEATLGNYSAAWRAQDEVIRIRGDQATSADFAELGEMMVLAAGGYVSPDAEGALAQALTMDPRNPVARYYWGLMMQQIGRPDVAFGVWDRLLADSSADAPWRAPVEARMPELARLAGVDYQPRPAAAPATLPGPSAEDIENAAEMTPEERMDMVRGMVDGLEARLAEDGGAPEDWARLITALGVLGQTDRAETARQQAEAAFAGDAAALATIAAATDRAGIGQ